MTVGGEAVVQEAGGRTSGADAASGSQPLEGLLERVRSVVPLIASRALQAERERKPDDDVIEALKATGVFRSFVPKRFGGYEIDMGLYVDIGVAVSEACASTGWITTFYMEHNWLLGFFSPDWQEEVFSASPYILAPGAVNPKSGKAVPVDGGYRLDGRWKFGTGVMHADWVLLSAQVETGDKPVQRMCMVPRDEVEVLDTWFVDGMAATGSQDIVARGVLVPEQHMSLLVPPFVTAGADATYLQRIPMRPFLNMTAAIPALGGARRAVELFRQLVTERVRFGTKSVQGESTSAQMRLARAIADVRSAEVRMRAVAQRIDDHANRRIELSALDLLEMALTIAHIVRDCRLVVQHVMEGSGASVHYLNHEMQRIARDLQMMSAHTVFDLDLAAENYGKARLESDEPLFNR